MTDTVTDSGREQRLTERVEQLYANDPQFRAAAPSPEVTEAAHRAGLRLAEVVDIYLSGYADRPALGQRACEVARDPATGRAATSLLSGFETITYRELGDRVAALAAAWRSGLPGGLRPGDFVGVLGFTSIDYVVHYLACIRLGAVFVPLQTSSTAAQLAPIVAETSPRILAVSVESLGTAVDVVLEAPSVQRLVVFDYTSDDDEQRGRYDDARARLRDAGHGAEMVALAAELASGRERPAPEAHVPGQGENPLATLIYTSAAPAPPRARCTPPT